MEKDLTVAAVLPIVREFARASGNEVGGHLNSVLYGGNVSDDHVRFCHERAEAESDTLAVEVACALLAMTRIQRRKLVAMFHVVNHTASGCGDGVHVAPTGGSCACGGMAGQLTEVTST